MATVTKRGQPYKWGTYVQAYSSFTWNNVVPIDIDRINRIASNGAAFAYQIISGATLTRCSIAVTIQQTRLPGGSYTCTLNTYDGTSYSAYGTQTFNASTESSVTHEFVFSNLNTNPTEIYFVIAPDTDGAKATISPFNTQITATLTVPNLSIGVSPRSLYTGNSVTVTIDGRLEETITVRAYYNNTTLLYEDTVNGDSIQITCPDTWFSAVGISDNSMEIKIRASDSLGRTSSDTEYTKFTLKKPSGGRINPIAPRSISKNLNEQIPFSWSYSGDGTLTTTELQWSKDNATWSNLRTVDNGDTTWTAPAYKFSIGTVYWRARATNSYGLTGDWCTSASFTGTYPALTVELTPSELYANSDLTVNIDPHGLLTQYTVRAYYNTTKLYEASTYSTTFTITCDDDWFSTAGVTSNSMQVKIIVSDGLERTSPAATFTLRIPVLSMTLDKTSVVIGDTITATFTGRNDRTIALSFITTKNNSDITLFSGNVTRDSIPITCSKTWFTDHSQLDNDHTITVKVTAIAGNNQATKSFEFKYTTLGVEVSETSIRVGESFNIVVTNRESEQLTVTMTANSRTVDETTAYSDRANIPTDVSYYNNAQDSRSTSLNVTVTVSDKRGRTASDTFSLSAYSDSMFPYISSVQSSIIQPQNVSTNYPNTYIANISKVKISVQVTFPTLAGSNRAVVNYSGTSMNLTYNASTGYYEATTINPITEDTTFQISITDYRGLYSTSSTSITDVVDYSSPTVNIINYHRCNADHTANDSGEYCEMTVEYTMSSIDDTNVGTASISSSIYTDSRTLQTYTQQIVYFFAANIEHSYDIIVSLADKIMSDSRTVRLSTAGVIMDFLSGGKGIGLGKVAETQKMVEVNPEWRFRSANIDVKVGNNMVDLGTLLAQIQQRLSDGGL